MRQSTAGLARLSTRPPIAAPAVVPQLRQPRSRQAQHPRNRLPRDKRVTGQWPSGLARPRVNPLLLACAGASVARVEVVMVMRSSPDSTAVGDRSSEGLLPELVEHLRQNRTVLREEWARRITEARLLTAMTPEEIFYEATSVYDNYVEVLETGSVEALQDYARNLSERIIPRGVETDEVLGIVLLLRDVLARSLFKKYQADFQVLNEVLDAYEPAANRIANTVGVNFVQERERIIRQQQEAIRELSTPVLQVRERLLILPIIGVLDG